MNARRPAMWRRSRLGRLSLGVLIGLGLSQAPMPALADFDAGVEAAKRRDYDTAFREFLAEAEAGNPRAQALVANMFRRGLGTDPDIDTAMAWYRRAAEAGDAMGQYNLAVAYREGVVVDRDEVLATRWFERAARQGMKEAQRNVGIRYAEGRGVDRDLVRAYAFLSLATAQGDVEALRERKALAAQLTREQIREARRMASTMR